MPLVPTINVLRRLNSGEYGDKYTTLAPTASIISSTPSTLCTLRLSITTTAPFHNFGASYSCTNLKKSSPFIDFPIVFIAISFFWLIAPTTVTLLPLEKGFISSTLSPFILRDLPLIIPSNTPISSKNTRFPGANFLIFYQYSIRCFFVLSLSAWLLRRLFFHGEFLFLQESAHRTFTQPYSCFILPILTVFC